MRETRADTVQATVLSLGLHVLLFALAFLGIWWTRNTAPVSAAGPVIEAELIDADALSESMRRVLRERPDPVEPAPAEPEPQPVERETIPPPQPVLEPIPQDSPVPPQPDAQEQIPDPDILEQERASAQAIADREAAEREQEERRRQEQIDLTERKRQEEAERQRRRTEKQRQREEQLADIRRRKEAAAREAELAQQKLDQLEAAQEAARMDAASPPPGNAGDSTDLTARYAAALTEAILRQWTRPETVPLGQRCRIVIRQIPGGEVIEAQVDPSCPYDERGRRSIEAAVLKAQPLPYAGFESVFARTLTLNFQAADR